MPSIGEEAQDRRGASLAIGKDYTYEEQSSALIYKVMSGMTGWEVAISVVIHCGYNHTENLHL